MGKSKSNSSARLPKEQRCHFFIGPISSWFMPSTSDIWTRPSCSSKIASSKTDIDTKYVISNHAKKNDCLSYIAYGSIGSFCYGEIYHHRESTQEISMTSNRLSALMKQLISIKEDNSRVSCIRFLKPAPYPMIMALTESGSFIIHDCMSTETLIHFRKTELIKKFVTTSSNNDDNNSEHYNKKTKFNVIQQINSCLWPVPTHAFLGISLLKEKTNLLIWLKLKDLTTNRDGLQLVNKTDIIESHKELRLDLPQYSNPICCMECTLLDSHTCLLAVAMDDGLINVVIVDLNEGHSKRVITLSRHRDQICSMSLSTVDKRFPLGLLASASRNGLVLLWDIENEFYFADYQAGSEVGNSRINWFSLSFIGNNEMVATKLVVSNGESGLSILDIPENTRSKMRLKEPSKDKNKNKHSLTSQTLRHHALIFNVVFDPVSKITMTSSLDGNHILWTSQSSATQLDQTVRRSQNFSLELKPQYLVASLPNNSRVHMMRHSPIQEDTLGICLGKAGVRFFKITENLANSRFDMSSSASLIARKITKASLCPTSISWHPSHEYRAAIGTIEGKVFRADLAPHRATLIEAEYRKIGRQSAKSSEPMVIDRDTNHGDLFDVEYQPLNHEDRPDEFVPKTDGVYSLCWGPNPTCPQDISRLAIYAVGSMTHRLHIYNSHKETGDKLIDYLDEFLDESLPEAIGEASEVSWKSSMDIMALGTTHGTVIVVEYLEEFHADRSKHRLFRRLAVIKESTMSTSYIQCLAWNPTTDKDDSNYYQIACSANESPVFIYDIKTAEEDNALASNVRDRLMIHETKTASSNIKPVSAVIITKASFRLDMHKKAISDIAWNPHDPFELATCSFDRFCYVWKMDEKSHEARVVSKFCALDRLFTVEWSLVDTDLIYTSGHDGTIWAWRPTENLSKHDNVITYTEQKV